MPVGYPMAIVQRAKELCEAGWTMTATSQIIASETAGEHQPSRQAIRRWIDPDYAEAERLTKRTGRSRKSRRKAWRFIFDRMKEMRELGISYRAIAVLISHDFEVSIDEEQARSMLSGRMRESTMERLLWPKGRAS